MIKSRVTADDLVGVSVLMLASCPPTEPQNELSGLSSKRYAATAASVLIKNPRVTGAAKPLLRNLETKPVFSSQP
jgi:hypothetical protein